MPKARPRKGKGGQKKGAKRSSNFQFRPLSSEDVAQILTEADAPLLSDKEIGRLTSWLNMALSEYGGRLEEYSEPTLIQLRKRVYAIHAALKRLKAVLPSAEERSLDNYLIYLGEEYARTRGPHPNLEPHEVWAVNPETEEEYGGVDHYHSDARLHEMVDCVTQILDWLDNSPKWVDQIDNWLDHLPHWMDEDDTDPRDRVRRQRDAHRRPGRTKVWLIGKQLPLLYEWAFGRGKYGVSRSTTPGQYGPGIRFVSAVLRHAGIGDGAGREISPETIIKYRRRARGLAS
jgi:hypothetical protein